MITSKIFAACLILAAQTYAVPSALLLGIYKAEGGQAGQEVPNANGTHDLGPMQINTVWVPDLAAYWGVSNETARNRIRDDVCTNVNVAAWILKTHFNETQSYDKALAYYHSRTPAHGQNYQKRVISMMQQDGLLRPAN